MSLVIRERPPLRLSFHTAGYCWAADEPDPSNVPGDTSLMTSMWPGVLSGCMQPFWPSNY